MIMCTSFKIIYSCDMVVHQELPVSSETPGITSNCPEVKWPCVGAFKCRNQALCIFYQLKYNEENSAQALDKFKALGDEYEICYLTESAVPVVVLKTIIYGNTFLFKEYLNEAPKENVSDKNILKLETKHQALKFMNEVYTLGPVEDDLYTSKVVCISL